MDRKRYADYENQFRNSITWVDRTIALYGMIGAIANQPDPAANVQPEPAPNVTLEASITALEQLLKAVTVSESKDLMFHLLAQIRNAAQTPPGEVIFRVFDNWQRFAENWGPTDDQISRVIGDRGGKIVFIPDQEGQQP